jgi:hypothetical protein
MAYTIDFCIGGNWGAALNNWTDSAITASINGLCAFIGLITGSDWSGRGVALERLLTLGPTSFIMLAFVVAIVLCVVVSTIWLHSATKRAEEDGTSNFLKEK